MNALAVLVRRACVLVLLGAGVSVAVAQAQEHDLQDAIPDAAVLKEGLFPEDACEELRRSGFLCMGVSPAVTFSLPSAAFALGSAVLPESLRRQLDVFAEVLSSKRGSSQRVRIVGHTDASGSEPANLGLSQRRAEAVKNYLVSKGADLGMLEVTGVGSNQPINGRPATAPENRRVSIGR